MTKYVYETIKAVVPEKKWIKKNGRVVSEETKQLFEKRQQEYQKQKPDAARRKARSSFGERTRVVPPPIPLW